MSNFCRPLLRCLLLASLLTGCSTPGTRARGHAAALRSLTPADQQLVMQGQIRPGMSGEAVYVAWGDPDEKAPGAAGKSVTETWIYRQRATVNEPMNSYYYYGPYHGFGSGWGGRGFLPDYTYGGVGYEGLQRYQPHVRSLDSVRVAEFDAGKVDRYKEADGTWYKSSAPIVAAGTRTEAKPVAVHHVTRLVHNHSGIRIAHAAVNQTGKHGRHGEKVSFDNSKLTGKHGSTHGVAAIHAGHHPRHPTQGDAGKLKVKPAHRQR